MGSSYPQVKGKNRKVTEERRDTKVTTGNVQEANTPPQTLSHTVAVEPSMKNGPLVTLCLEPDRTAQVESGSQPPGQVVSTTRSMSKVTECQEVALVTPSSGHLSCWAHARRPPPPRAAGDGGGQVSRDPGRPPEPPLGVQRAPGGRQEEGRGGHRPGGRGCGRPLNSARPERLLGVGSAPSAVGAYPWSTVSGPTSREMRLKTGRMALLLFNTSKDPCLHQFVVARSWRKPWLRKE
ncbi:uncharacterized protein LOC128314288 [Acinonyx jubatus]|uniref:Uncharacterized protein LOC128314288 n=1 Tax=Acinonyx jubatus TaxID=32536 RepID=A0ABM3PKE8_ACIJB|nr:uncharacterized protein LOC128314288 [Acinonyx jubatus]